MMNQQTTSMLCTMTHNLSTQGKSKGISARRVFAALMFALIISVLLAAMLCGTRVYSVLQSNQSASNDARVALSLATNSVRANDSVDMVAVGSGPEGRALILREASDFEKRIYLYQGHIVEEYALADAACTPEKATPLVASETFGFSYQNGLLTFTCDQGTSQVVLHSVRGGA